MDPEEVTLAVPCYNAADTLPQVLAAIDSLEPAPAEVVCVDDGSADRTKDVIESHDHVSLLEHRRNRGLGATLNTALEYANTPGFAKIDADIVVGPDWLGRLCEIVMEKDVALVQGKFDERVTTAADKWRNLHLTEPLFPKQSIYNKPINGSNILCRAVAVRDVGGWDERYRRVFDDIDLMERMLRAGHRLYYAADVAATHIRTDTWYSALRKAWAYHYDLFSPDNGRSPPERYPELLSRSPAMAVRTGRSIQTDIKSGNHDLLWISLLRPIFHLKWDIESIYSTRAE